MNSLGKKFNDYEQDFSSKTVETLQSVEVTIPAIKIRLFGDDKQKQEEWKKAWPQFPANIFWTTVSSEVPEIWGKIRIVNGKLTPNHLCLGHEFWHIVIVAVARQLNIPVEQVQEMLLNPDELINL